MELEDNVPNLDNAAIEIRNSAISVSQNTARIFELIGSQSDDGETSGLGKFWSGEVYNSFVSKCNAYRASLDELSEILTAMADMVDKVSEEATNLNKNVASSCNI